MITRTASIPTERPARWAKQLLSHFSAKVEVVHDGEGGSITLGSGTGVVRVEPNLLVLEASAETEADIQRVQSVLGGHLERFAAKDGLAANWSERS